MGGSKNKTGESGNDPKGRVQNAVAHQQQRYEQQQGPMVQAFAQNYGRGSESNYGDYTDIMNQYRGIASGGGAVGAGDEGGGGGGGGGGGMDFTPSYNAYTVSPGRAGYTDPFESYAGMKEFSQTGGYSKEDIANMRARGTSPIRAAYANAERDQGRARSLQGGYSPNAFAASARMAREQGQSAADATQNVEAGLAEARNAGRRYGLTGMQGTEGQRLSADVDVSKFNTGLDFEGQKFNAGAYSDAEQRNMAAQERAAASRAAAGAASADRAAAASAASRADQLRALQGMTQLYGTTPGMAATFGNQLLAGVGQGGTIGTGFINAETAGQRLPGQYEQTLGRVQDIGNMAGQVGSGIADIVNSRKKQNPAAAGPYNTGGGYSPWGYQESDEPYLNQRAPSYYDMYGD
jgi:hypothetical protein